MSNARYVVDLDIASAMEPIELRLGGETFESRVLSFLEAEGWRKRLEGIEALDEAGITELSAEFLTDLELPVERILELGPHAVLQVILGFFVALRLGPASISREPAPKTQAPKRATRGKGSKSPAK